MSLEQTIRTVVADAIERRLFPGAVVAVARGADLLHHDAYGSTMYGGPEAQPVRPDTIYDIASLTKMFTATAALIQHDAGLLALDAPASRYLPETSLDTITITHLLTHTSGLDMRLSTLRHLGPGLLDTVLTATPIRAPGSTVAYTNVNSLLLGAIVARLHGASLDVAIDDLICAPLGLADTCFRPAAQLLPRIAPTEHDADWRGGLVHGSVHDESAHALGGIAGHAGMFSTAADMLRFCQGWLAALHPLPGVPALLQPATARRATSNHTPGLALSCGLGWMMDRPSFMGHAPAGTVGHTGFTGPAMVIVPQHDLVVVMLNNRVYPQRTPPAHNVAIAAIVDAALPQDLT